jgi:hypothetical protein
MQVIWNHEIRALRTGGKACRTPTDPIRNGFHDLNLALDYAARWPGHDHSLCALGIDLGVESVGETWPRPRGEPSDSVMELLLR